jgi:ferredoxin
MFDEQITDKINRKVFNTPESGGHIPYKERVKFGGVAPETDEDICTLCGRCAEVCPVRVITVSNSVTTQAQGCIMCSACVKSCKIGARSFNHPIIKERQELLIKYCSTPKTPQIFL